MANAILHPENIAANNAGIFLRFLNMLIDMICLGLLGYILNIICGIIFNISIETLSRFHSYALSLLIYLSYYILMEYTFQKSIGKFITKTSVVTKKGLQPTLVDIIARTFYRLIPFDAISYLFTPNGFHDHLSATTVVSDKYAD